MQYGNPYFAQPFQQIQPYQDRLAQFGGVFKMLGNPACSPNNNLTAINGTAPTTEAPVTQAVRKGAL